MAGEFGGNGDMSFPVSTSSSSSGPSLLNMLRDRARQYRGALLSLLLVNTLLLLFRPAWTRPCAGIKTCPSLWRTRPGGIADPLYLASSAGAVAPTTTSNYGCPNQTIPKVVHFVYGLSNDAHISFSFLNYLVIKAAHKHLRPSAILYHHINLPESKWFKHARRFIVLSPVKPFTEIYGNPVDHFAHRADIVRLRALQRYGGIYLDMDVLTLRPFDALLSHDMVMAQEGEGGRVGLCNAVILAKKGSEFVDMWLDSYKSFNQSDWNYHSVM